MGERVETIVSMASGKMGRVCFEQDDDTQLCCGCSVDFDFCLCCLCCCCCCLVCNMRRKGSSAIRNCLRNESVRLCRSSGVKRDNDDDEEEDDDAVMKDEEDSFPSNISGGNACRNSLVCWRFCGDVYRGKIMGDVTRLSAPFQCCLYRVDGICYTKMSSFVCCFNSVRDVDEQNNK